LEQFRAAGEKISPPGSRRSEQTNCSATVARLLDDDRPRPIAMRLRLRFATSPATTAGISAAAKRRAGKIGSLDGERPESGRPTACPRG